MQSNHTYFMTLTIEVIVFEHNDLSPSMSLPQMVLELTQLV